MSDNDILFVDLSLVEGKDFDGMAEGKFTDMYGREVELEGLSDYLDNTLENLEATRTEGGELVGLPIDARGHENGDGAGWIVGLELADSVIRFSVKWTEIGLELIKKGIRRFFSPTIDVKNKVILGGSLTNWPATRTKKGKILLRPIELSEQLLEAEQVDDETFIQRISDLMSRFMNRFTKADWPETDEEIPTEDTSMTVTLEELTPEQRAEIDAQALAKLSSSNPPAELSAFIDAEANRRMAALLEAEQRKVHVAEFTARVVGGTEDKPIGLPVEQDKLVSFLASLSTDQQKEAEEILTSIHDKAAINFQEKGHGKQVAGSTELPEVYKTMLKSWVDGGESVAKFFSINSVELGDMKDYNLSEFEKED